MLVLFPLLPTYKKVTQAFLLRLANKIYNPKTKKYLRLCKGTLQNGPDPVSGRPMHCAIGELCYAMYGKQPKKILGSEIDNFSSQYLAYMVCKEAANTTGLHTAEARQQFEIALNRIIYVNDASKGGPPRSRKVAKAFREAAELLPLGGK